MTFCEIFFSENFGSVQLCIGKLLRGFLNFAVFLFFKVVYFKIHTERFYRNCWYHHEPSLLLKFKRFEALCTYCVRAAFSLLCVCVFFFFHSSAVKPHTSCKIKSSLKGISFNFLSSSKDMHIRPTEISRCECGLQLFLSPCGPVINWRGCNASSQYSWCGLQQHLSHHECWRSFDRTCMDGGMCKCEGRVVWQLSFVVWSGCKMEIQAKQ